MQWWSLILGLLIGWLIEWLIDFFYWRRRYRNCTEARAGLEGQLRTAKSDAQLELARLQRELSAAQARIADLEGQLAAQQTERALPADVTPTRTAEAVPLAPPAAPEDLELIEGIGPAIARLLREAGINTFADLAAAQPDALKAILEAAGPRYRMAQPQTWPEQAALAARGDWAGLKALQARLQAGRA